MSRVIKFRAWSKDYGKLFMTDEEQNLDLLPIWIRNPQSYDLMQFTGLLDKNGKEIYEGDVVSGDGSNFVVTWNDREARYFYKVINPSHTDEDNWDIEWDVEIIGNIYENPELLKV